MVGEMVKDDAGYLWVATSGGGLNRLDPESGKFKHYTTKEGMLSNTITNVVMDNQGYLWVSSFRGLERFDPGTGECISYDKSDGLLTLEFTQGTAFKSPSGHIYLAGPGGITYFHPDSLTINRQVPGVVITNMYLFDNPLSLDLTQQIELRHTENFLTFEFAALNFTNSQKNQYRYRMIGLDPDTVEAGLRRTASYTDIKPGTYTFWVTGSNNDGFWNPEGKSVEITIRPPWSRSGLAIGLYVLLFITAVMGIIRLRTWKLINDRKVLEKQVRERTRLIEEKDRHILEMDRMKTRFFANVSHEFRTPLTLILSPLEELISRRKPGDPEMRKLGVIRRNSMRLLDLVNQLLDLSKLDSGKLKLELVHEDLVKVLRLTCASFISLAEKNRIKYNFHLPNRGWITWFDAGKLETILNNLLSNAFKYTPREGIVDCFVRMEVSENSREQKNGPEHLSISVIDSGPGIPKEKLDLIFDRFYQGEEHNHLEGGGTGIGLSLTRELVELIHGEITVNSEPGEGSCFTVRIPLGKEHLKESEYIIRENGGQRMPQADHGLSVANEKEKTDEQNETSPPLPPLEPIHLLVVEDNSDLRSYLREQLQNHYTIVEARAGEEGLKRALRVIPDLIITDVMMPGMDGIELCKRLKTNERTSHIPVIMLTAKADFDSRIKGLETGADDYILKPFHIKELKTRIHNLIHQRNLLRERFSRNVDTIAEDFRLNSYDVRFIRRITEVVENHLPDFEFDVKQLQENSGMSHTQLYRKLHALTGLSPSRFIRHLRLKRAVRLLEEDQAPITHVAFEVGFGNLSYFTKCFKEEFGISPSEYSKQYK
jgi:signal transduction histidine kinase/DNA-binding response OmpR family regulator